MCCGGVSSWLMALIMPDRTICETALPAIHSQIQLIENKKLKKTNKQNGSPNSK
jgi:hypothetical protein